MSGDDGDDVNMIEIEIFDLFVENCVENFVENVVDVFVDVVDGGGGRVE